ncbi:hypothetical protein EDC01DRAFT_779478 [Geopyxis carbonaria]|nr:hypothetical protein EDC01DRAFT_779478 [Geopyxis carbonaria]
MTDRWPGSSGRAATRGSVRMRCADEVSVLDAESGRGGNATESSEVPKAFRESRLQGMRRCRSAAAPLIGTRYSAGGLKWPRAPYIGFTCWTHRVDDGYARHPTQPGVTRWGGRVGGGWRAAGGLCQCRHPPFCGPPIRALRSERRLPRFSVSHDSAAQDSVGPRAMTVAVPSGRFSGGRYGGRDTLPGDRGERCYGHASAPW